MLVFGDHDRPGPAARHLDRDDLAGEKSVGLGRSVFLLRSLREDIGRFALVAMCVGVGQGIAAVLERVS